MERMSYHDNALISGAGVMINVIMALGIFWMLGLVHAIMLFFSDSAGASLFNLRMFLYPVIIALLIVFRRFFCAYVIPVLGIGTLVLLAYLFVTAPFKDVIGGPITIVVQATEYTSTIQNSLIYLASLSLAIGIGNMMPILPLDGGRIMGAAIKYRLGKRWINAYRICGTIFIAGLMVLALGGDIFKVIDLISH